MSGVKSEWDLNCFVNEYFKTYLFAIEEVNGGNLTFYVFNSKNLNFFLSKYQVYLIDNMY